MHALLDSAGLRSSLSLVTTVEQGDFLDSTAFDWTAADIVFVNSTCFSDALMQRLQAEAASLRTGARVMTLTKHFSMPAFQVVDSVNYTMSWGLATCYFHRRL